MPLHAHLYHFIPLSLFRLLKHQYFFLLTLHMQKVAVNVDPAYLLLYGSIVDLNISDLSGVT